MSLFPFMSLLHFLTFLFYAVIIILILSRGTGTALNRISLGLYSCFALWSLGKIFLHNLQTPQSLAVLFDRMIAIAWCAYPSLSLWFTLLLTKNTRILRSRLFYVAITAIPVLFIGLHWAGFLMYLPVRKYYGWNDTWNLDSIWTYFYFAFYLGSAFFSIFSFLYSASRAPNSAYKKQLNILALSTALPLAIGTYFQVIATVFRLPGWDTPLRDITNVYILIWALGTYYAIVKHRLFAITPVTAAENIISNMSEALLLLDSDLKVIYANNYANRMLNYSDNGLFSMHFSALLKEKSDINKILKTSIVYNSASGVETILMRKGGGPVPVILSFNTLSESGDIKGFSCIATDITERKIAEFQIKAERNRAQKYFDTADIMFIMVDMWRRVTMVNKRACEILEYRQEEILGKNWTATFVPERQERDMNIVFEQIVYNNNILGDVEGYIKTKTGKERLIRWSNTLMKNESGEATGVLSAGYDITEQALVQEQIKKLSVAVEQSPNITIITDTEGSITYVNPMFTQVTGYTKEEVVGKNPRILQSGELPKEKYREMWDTITAGKQWRGFFHNRKKDGELYWESASISPIKDYKDVITSYIAIKEDITAQKKAEEDLKASYEKLKELDIMKTSFTSMVSHELRTPLTSIKGFLSLLLSGVAGKLTSTQKEFLETIRNNSERLLSLINDILDVSKMEAGSFTIDKKPCNIIEITESSIKDIRSIADKKKIKIELEYTFNDPLIKADAYRVSQVIINLINNAIKFSPQDSAIELRISRVAPGSIAFPAHFTSPAFDKDSILFTFTDHGIGIRKDNLPKIFMRFYQVENINTRHAQGTGLGLSIARNIVEAHGGCMWADSEGEGKGAVFSFLMPIE